ncbi:MAG: nucleotidyltransferase domain-containing protein [Candidatus Omnitrophota bacterium]|jgi:predicted nucleotidyltransferase|nr:MAG: nucleotidyltransferase domain-containing protein [Candidatus Omnitrophota bacterium]
MKTGLTPNQLETIRSFLALDASIEEAILFGSRATGTFKKASDIDLAIKGKSFDLFKASSLKSQLEEETHIPFFFDIIAYSSIQSNELKQHIQENGMVIYRKEEREWNECKIGDLGIVHN